MKILIAGMGNVLRGDDGFGIRVVNSLAVTEELGKGVDIYEAGIGGIGLVQELMNGYDVLILVDAIDKGAEPGALFVVEPEMNSKEIEPLILHESLVDMHYADPSKVIMLAKALDLCPPRVLLVGCQPEYVDEAVEGLRPSVQRAVPLAVNEIRKLVAEFIESSRPKV